MDTIRRFIKIFSFFYITQLKVESKVKRSNLFKIKLFGNPKTKSEVIMAILCAFYCLHGNASSWPFTHSSFEDICGFVPFSWSTYDLCLWLESVEETQKFLLNFFLST